VLTAEGGQLQGDAPHRVHAPKAHPAAVGTGGGTV
jgi:hypothetical protein